MKQTDEELLKIAEDTRIKLRDFSRSIFEGDNSDPIGDTVDNIIFCALKLVRDGKP